MKKIFVLLVFSFIAYMAMAQQEFTAQLNAAKSAYTAGKLDDSRFAMQQMLQEIDIIVGKEVLKLLPPKLSELAANTKVDNVNGASGLLGVVIHREYGSDKKTATLEVNSNSPMMAGINAILSLPLIGNSGDSKVVKIQGYKGLMQRNAGEVENTYNYELQLPVKSSLVTLKAPGFSSEDLIKMANTLPLDKIASMLD